LGVLLSGTQAVADSLNPLCAHTLPDSDDTDSGSDEISALVGPTGRLRVAFNYGIVINAKCVDTTTGQLCSLSGPPPKSATYSGIAVDLGCQLAVRLGVPLDFVPYSTQPAQTLGLYAGAWDVGFTYDPITGLPAGMAAGHPHLLIELAFVVPAGSPYEQVADVPYDAVINVAAGTTGVILLGQLGYTNVHQVANGPTALSRVQLGEIAAVGRSIGVPFANTAANYARILPDNYGYAHATMAIAAGSPQAVHYLSVFVEWAKKKGLIQRAINAVIPPLIGVQVPPPEKVGGVRREARAFPTLIAVAKVALR
jgi:ABC-type amino acid transport substrate-binding protein